MPRRTRPRPRAAEEQLARRIGYEREKRDWTYEALARHMSEAGCSILPSAIYKIERANRRITVEELVALASVFDTDTDGLLLPPELLEAQAVREALERYRSAEQTYSAALKEILPPLASARENMFRVLKAHPESEPVVRSYLEEWLGSADPKGIDDMVGRLILQAATEGRLHG